MYTDNLDLVQIALNKPRDSRGGTRTPTGVICPYCGVFGILYMGKQTWSCTSCAITKTSAELKADVDNALKGVRNV
jgi:hypothetical protein